MHPQDSPGRQSAPPSGRDLDPQELHEYECRELLDLLLKEFPGLLTFREASVARVDDHDDPIRAEDFGNAVRGLAQGGLVVREGDLLLPSRAARAMVDLGYELG